MEEKNEEKINLGKVMTVLMTEEELKFEDEKEDDKSKEKKADIRIEYTIRDETAENQVGDEGGSKEVALDDDKIKKLGTYIWENIIETLDYDFLDGVKGGTALKFVCDCDITAIQTGESKSLKMVFDLKDGKFILVGWTFQVDTGVGEDSIKSLDKKLKSWLTSIYPVEEE